MCVPKDGITALVEAARMAAVDQCVVTIPNTTPSVAMQHQAGPEDTMLAVGAHRARPATAVVDLSTRRASGASIVDHYETSEYCVWINISGLLFIKLHAAKLLLDC